ncbi:hypothetical protein ACROYT_G000683 [Oculina patagonica]
MENIGPLLAVKKASKLLRGYQLFSLRNKTQGDPVKKSHPWCNLIRRQHEHGKEKSRTSVKHSKRSLPVERSSENHLFKSRNGK